jgi:O-antigen ligase
MPGLLPRALGRSAGDLSFWVFLVTVVLCLFRARDLPSVAFDVVGTELELTPADLALAATAVLALARLRARRRVPAPALRLAALAFAGLLLASSLPNGADAVVAAAKLLELGALALGAVAFVTGRDRLQALLVVLVGFAAVAAGWGLVGFLTADRGRQASFMGEHDLAALATMVFAVGLARLHARRGWPGPLALVGIAGGVTGIVLGAALASLLGLYLATAAILVVALRRRELGWTAGAVTVAVAAVATAGTLALRQGDLGFLQSWFGPPAETPGEYAASWSQRLIYTYVGGRVFLDRPVLGTGWHGELPPETFAEYVPDARERFSDQPPHYFPPTDRGFIPQQTYDQVLFELGLVGAALFALLGVVAVRRAAAAVRRRDTDAAYLPPAWLASLAGVLAGAALFGGSPLTAVFWLTLGVVAAEPEAQT